MQSTLIHYYQDFMDTDFPLKFELKHKLNLNLNEHAHEYFQICYLTKGSCIHYVQDREIVLVKGDMFAIPPYVPHRLKPYRSQPVEIAQIDFMPIVVEQDDLALDSCYFPKINIPLSSQLIFEQLIHDMKQEHDTKETGYRLLLKADLIRVLVTAFREGNRIETETASFRDADRMLFHQTVSYINEHYTENLQLDDLARMSALSPTYFSYLFKVIQGRPFVQYVNALRISNTMELLRTTDWSITRICLESGFNNASHFNRVFRKETGLSPLQYRKGLRSS